MSVGQDVLDSLQQRFESALSGVGYSRAVSRLPSEVGRSERLLRFVEWSLEVIQPTSYLTTAELER